MLNGSLLPSQNRPATSSSRVSGVEDSSELAVPPFICVSAALRRLLLQAETSLPRVQFATLEGEPGTGKHLFAQTLHHQSALANLPFRRRDAREWLATEADTSTLSGTLYLDRVDLLASPGQGLLLNLIKVLQNSGLDDSARPPLFLLLLSAHASLRLLAGEGLFLPDLAFRITAVRFPLPPLREHREDIAPIAQALVDRICRRYHRPTAVLSPGTIPHLLQHTWPGNIHELASVLESAILESTTGVIRPTDLMLQLSRELSREITSSATTPQPTQFPQLPDDLTLSSAVLRHIQLVLDLNRGNKLRAARQLGISRSTLYRILGGESSLPS